MPPGAAFCPVFGGAFTVRFVTFSVVMGDGTDLNVTKPLAPRSGEKLPAANKRLKAGVEVSEGASTNTYLNGGAARAAARALPRGAQEGNEAASLHPLDLVLEACAT